MSRPRADELSDYNDALFMHGHAAAAEHPWDHADEVAEELANELEARLERKRPPGFAPWPE